MGNQKANEWDDLEDDPAKETLKARAQERVTRVAQRVSPKEKEKMVITEADHSKRVNLQQVGHLREYQIGQYVDSLKQEDVMLERIVISGIHLSVGFTKQEIAMQVRNVFSSIKTNHQQILRTAMSRQTKMLKRKPALKLNQKKRQKLKQKQKELQVGSLEP